MTSYYITITVDDDLMMSYGQIFRLFLVYGVILTWYYITLTSQNVFYDTISRKNDVIMTLLRQIVMN